MNHRKHISVVLEHGFLLKTITNLNSLNLESSWAIYKCQEGFKNDDDSKEMNQKLINFT